MTNEEMLNIALKQSALELNCTVDDLTRGKSKAVISMAAEGARKYLSLPFYCQLVSYGSGIVASVNEEIYADAKAYIEKYAPEHCFETPNMLVLQSALERRGMSACFMAEYWLCDTGAIRPLDCGYELRLLTAEDFAPLYTPQWSNALCEKRKELDVLGIGAYDGGKLVGFAGCSADCESMWQIGVDVLPEYRRRGIASAVTGRLAAEIMARGKVPFYCCAWSNVASARNAIRAGFRPAWVELTAKSAEYTADMNK